MVKNTTNESAWEEAKKKKNLQNSDNRCKNYTMTRMLFISQWNNIVDPFN